jgi:hypothetical protein
MDHKLLSVQLQDITGWGNSSEVSKLLLPVGARVTKFEQEKVDRPPKDTRTIMGVVDVPPLNIYRRVHLMTAAAESLAEQERRINTFSCFLISLVGYAHYALRRWKSSPCSIPGTR